MHFFKVVLTIDFILSEVKHPAFTRKQALINNCINLEVLIGPWEINLFYFFLV